MTLQPNTGKKIWKRESVAMNIFWIPVVKACKTKETPIKIIL